MFLQEGRKVSLCLILSSLHQRNKLRRRASLCQKWMLCKRRREGERPTQQERERKKEISFGSDRRLKSLSFSEWCGGRGVPKEDQWRKVAAKDP